MTEHHIRIGDDMIDADVALIQWEQRWDKFKSDALPKAASNARECLESFENGGDHPLLCLTRRNNETLNADELATTEALLVDVFGKSA